MAKGIEPLFFDTLRQRGNLVSNFENLNPANTLVGKPYRLHSNVDNKARSTDYSDLHRLLILLRQGQQGCSPLAEKQCSLDNLRQSA